MLKFRAGALSFTLPESWAEVTLGQFLALSDPDAPTTPAFIITTLSGLSEEVLRPHSAPFDLKAVVLSHLDYITDAPEVPDAMPKHLTIAGKSITLPDDLGAVATLGQMWDVDLVIRERQKNEQPFDPAALANILLPVFLWPLLRDEPYTDRYQAADLWPVRASLPCIEGLAISGFFLRSSLAPMSTGKISVTRLPLTRSNNWRHGLFQLFRRFKPSSLVSS